MIKERLDGHLKIWRLSKAHPQAADERPPTNEFHPNQDLQEKEEHVQYNESRRTFHLVANEYRSTIPHIH